MTREPKPTYEALERRCEELERQIALSQKHNASLREDRDAYSEMITAYKDQVDECSAQIVRWIEAFEMVKANDGTWQWDADMIRSEWFEKYQDLRTQWNRFVPEYNARVAPRNMGRPLGASPAQVSRVLKAHEAGESIRSIAESMELGVRTVRTIIDKRDGVDRATVKRLERIAPDRIAEARARRSMKEIAALPRRINANLERNAELIKAAKGLK